LPTLFHSQFKLASPCSLPNNNLHLNSAVPPSVAVCDCFSGLKMYGSNWLTNSILPLADLQVYSAFRFSPPNLKWLKSNEIKKKEKSSSNQDLLKSLTVNVLPSILNLPSLSIFFSVPLYFE
jgi:hypothetical protein